MSEQLVELTDAEALAAEKVREMFEAIAVVEQAGGDPNKAFLAALPPGALEEAKRQMPILQFLGL